MLWLIGIVLMILVLVWGDLVKPVRYPPGPKWVPYFGNTFAVQRLSREYGGLHEVFKYYSKEYHSPVVGLRLGRELTVGIRGYELAKEALTSDDLLGRPDNFFVRLRTCGERLVLELPAYYEK